MESQPTDEFDTPRFRSGVAARMARIPSSTLRIWERRHKVVGPSRSPAGQRLYSRRDVQRLVMIKTLCDRGHAISTLAPLQIEALDSLLQSESFVPGAMPRAPATVIAIGPGWERPEADGGNDRLWYEYAGIAQAAAEMLPRPIDVMLVRESALQEDAAAQLLSIAGRAAARVVAVAYSFASAGAMQRLNAAGARLYREVGQPRATADLLTEVQSAARAEPARLPLTRAPRRYSDGELAAATSASALISCECPRHLSDIIRQLSSFEAYCDTCVSRDADDALLHRHLGDVTNAARQMFESALARLIELEGLPVSGSRNDGSPGRADGAPRAR